MRACLKLLLLALALLPARALAQRLCFPEASTPLGGGEGKPRLDGNVRDDLGWSNAFRYVFELPAEPSGTAPDKRPHAALQGLRKGSDLYLSIEVENDTGFEEDDGLVLAFRPLGTDQYRIIHISPVHSGVGNATNSAPFEMKAWKISGPPNPAAWKQPTAIANPQWIEVRTATSGAEGPGPKAWSAEVLLPGIHRSGQGLELGGVEEFDFYVALRVALPDKEAMLVWPPGAPATNPNELPNKLAAPTTWSRAKLSGTDCGGVSLRPEDIRTVADPADTVDFARPGPLRATVNNTSVNASEIATAADAIAVTFLVSNEGVTAQGFGPWQPLRAADNPTAWKTILPKGSQTFSTGELKEIENQNEAYRAHPNQIVLVKLDARPGSTGTYIARRSAWRSMQFIAKPIDKPKDGICGVTGGTLGAISLGLLLLGVMRRRRNGGG